VAATFLSWREVTPSVVPLEAPREVFHDSAPLTDVTRTGPHVACLRRGSDTDVLVWRRGIDAEPAVWSTRSSSVFQLVGGSDDWVIINSGDGFVRIGADGRNRLYSTRSHVMGATASSNRQRLLWLERANNVVLRVGEIGSSSLTLLHEPLDCLMAAWVDQDNVILIRQPVRGAPLECALLNCATGAISVVARTSRFVRLLAGGESGVVALSAQGALSGTTDPPSGNEGCWKLQSGDISRGFCLASIAASAFFSVGKASTVFAERDASPARTWLCAASESDVKRSSVAALIRDAMVSDSRLLYRGYGQTGSILELDIGPLIAA
jgi:hypothetical protein